MALIKFEDSCIITRDNGKFDEFDNPITWEVYKGKCRYQQGVQAYMGISQRNSVVFLDGNVRVSENDVCVIVQSNGVMRKGVVKTVRNIKQPLTGKRTMRMELTQDTEVME